MGKFHSYWKSIKSLEKKNETSHSVKWQLSQWFAVVLLCLQLAWIENSLLKGVEGEYDRIVSSLVQDYLNKQLWFFLPDQFWFLVLPLSIVTIGFLLFTRFRWLFFTVSTYGLVLLLMSNRIYFSFFDSVIPVSALEITGQLWKVKSSVLHSLALTDLFWLLSFLWVPIYGFIFHRVISTKLKRNKWVFVSDKLMGVFCLALVFHAMSIAFLIQDKEVLFEGRKPIRVNLNTTQASNQFVVPYHSSYRTFAVTFGLFNFYIYNLNDYYGQNHQAKELSEPELKKVAEFLSHRKNLNDQDAAFSGLAKGRNVLLFSLESFSSWLIGLEVDGQEITPTLNKLAKNHLYWSKIIDGARAGGTSDAEFSILTGLLTDLSRVAAMGIAEKNQLLGLPASLKAAGYATYSFHGNDSSFWNRNITHPKLGVEQLIFQEKFPQEEVVGLGVPDHVMFEKTMDVLNEAEQPFFGFVISLTSHHPYPDLPFDYSDLRLENIKHHQLKRYLKLANYTDKALGNFLERLSQRNMLENTILVLYGDHKPPFDNQGYKAFEALIQKPLMKGRLLQIPLVIAIPGEEETLKGAQVTVEGTIGGLQDVYPTLLHLLGLEIPYGLYGVNLMIPNEERGVFPLLKMPGSFAYKGFVFSGKNGRMVSDTLGALFHEHKEDPLLDDALKREQFQRAFHALEIHLHLFNQNGQFRAREERAPE